MQLYNTLTRSKQQFVPGNPKRVTMYVCGPTVYSYAHIGNARPAVVFDLLARVLRHRFGELVYARNITDIDDKINTAAAEQGVPISVITEKYTEAYHDDLTALGVQPPDIEPRVTAFIPDIIAMIDRLIEGGFAYAADGHVLFHVPSFPRYGQLSHRDLDDMLAGARVEVAPYKQDPADFVLWKPSTPDLPGWESPWGRGRPGWHIECSCMIESHLGETIDIHGGGHDLIFPHHENENAQSTCVHGGKPLARFWVHNGFVNVASEKMSKSLGNVLLVRDLLRQAPGEAIRMALLTAHYRAPLDWTDDGLEQAKRRLDRMYQALRELADIPVADDVERRIPPDFLAALEDDLNTPRALAELAELVHAANTTTDRSEKSRLKAALIGAGGLLGLLQQDPENWFAGERADIETAEIEALIADRNAARQRRDYRTADVLRDRLAELGVSIEDAADGTRWRFKD